MWLLLFIVSLVYNFYHGIKNGKTPCLKSAKDLYQANIHLLKNIKCDENLLLNLLDEIRINSVKRTDINDHLLSLFFESLNINPRLIVELGVRGGESTFVLERVARICGSTLVSLDIKNCARISSYEKWIFVRQDDIQFARRFKEWCEERGIKPEIDVLFIDTSHLYEHTLSEIKHWFPFLAQKAKVFFHDTNLRRFFKRRDGSMGVGWNNRRGVIRAIEDYFSRSFNETADFTATEKGWHIDHYAPCNGFIVLTR
jgi:cephalosporin hydroxylase